MKQIAQPKKTHLDRRALTSLFMFFSGFWLVPTGIIMHFVAQSSNELVRHIVMSMHDTASVIFVVSVIVHLTLNWKPMSRYIATKINEYSPFKTELIIAAITVTVLILLIGTHPLHLR
jgi:hypothetical protein